MHPTRILFGVALVAAVAAVVLVLLADRTERGTGTQRIPTPAGTDLQPVSLKQSGAVDFDPFGDDESEHPEEVKFVLDGMQSSTWSTENYRGKDFQKPGVGFFIDAKPEVVARLMEIRSPTPGFTVEVYAAKNGAAPTTLPDPGWLKLSFVVDAGERERVQLDTAGQPFRYYLLWFTKLPPDASSLEISEVALFK